MVTSKSFTLSKPEIYVRASNFLAKCMIAAHKLVVTLSVQSTKFLVSDIHWRAISRGLKTSSANVKIFKKRNKTCGNIIKSCNSDVMIEA